MGEGEFVVGALRVGEGEGQSGADLEHGAFSDGSALLGFDAAGFDCGDGLGGVGVGPVDVAKDAVVAAFPAQGGNSGQGGGEVAGESVLDLISRASQEPSMPDVGRAANPS
ncbi:hypothetical protein GCM10022284_76140 [Streptomyces hundungensis]